ncbi:phage tail assembly protein [Streptomyces sp. B8F3]|uniref:phage tail assembly protein n=1 Tax=Streptomyces sp. B8F3 TaxID=3153573 RepID=UPI00325DD12A
MSRIALDDIRRAAEARYGDFTIDLPDGTPVTLRSPLRLSDDERDLLRDVEQLAAAGDTGAITEALKIAAKSEAEGDRLLSAIGGDLTVAVTVFEQWAASVSLGEAGPSAS